jgi:superfamily II DNA or RNA helicase
MMQSLISKEYPQALFEQFGFTIIDEVHHISSETFSNALFKVVTKYMLGLSATMDRKDGTTFVFKYFLGEIIHKVVRKGEHKVEVRAIEYKTQDPEFNESILDFRGKVQFSSMINKLCTYNRRTEFIIQTLVDYIRVDGITDEEFNKHKQQMDEQNPCCELCERKDNYLIRNTCCNVVKYCYLCMENINQTTEKKIRPKCPNCKKVLKFEQNYIENPHIKSIDQAHTIIMSHNLNVIDYIYKKMICKNIASVGLYIGGMKEVDLKRSDKQQVILATISLAAEGLDIPSLNAEFLITPKSDIVQIVGRVLRTKHVNKDTVIYDFIDSHDIFKNQWRKNRKPYYKSQNFHIIQTDSINYTRDFNKWDVIHSSTMKLSPENPSGKCLIPL